MQVAVDAGLSTMYWSVIKVYAPTSPQSVGEAVISATFGFVTVRLNLEYIVLLATVDGATLTYYDTDWTQMMCPLSIVLETLSVQVDLIEAG